MRRFLLRFGLSLSIAGLVFAQDVRVNDYSPAYEYYSKMVWDGSGS